MRLTCAIPAAVMLLSSFVAALDNAELNSASIQAMERPNVAFYKKNQGDGDYNEEDFKDKFKHKYDDGPDIVIIDQKTETVTQAYPVTVTVTQDYPVTVTVTQDYPVTVTVTVTETAPPAPIPSCFEADTRTPAQQRGTPFSYSDCAAICQRQNLPIAGLQYRVRQNSNNLYACFCYPSTGTLPNVPSDRCHLFQESSNPNNLYYYGETVEEIYLFPATPGNVPSGITTPVVP